MNPGGIKDKSYNSSVWSGIQMLVKEMQIDIKSSSAETLKAGRTQIEKAISNGSNLIVILPRLLIPEVEDIIKKNPEVEFIIFDNELNYKNVTPILFDNYQAGFLAGYIASRLSESRTIGFLGADKTTMTADLNKGYINGAKRYDEKIRVISEYLENYEALTDKKAIKNKTDKLLSEGVDIIFPPTGIASLTVYELIAQKNKLAIGFDANQDYYEEGYIITSIIRKLDLAIYEVITDILNGEPENTYQYSIEDDYIDYSQDTFSDLFLTPEIKKELDNIKDELTSEKPA
jgi:basic membrane protein A